MSVRRNATAKAFGAALKKARLVAGISQEELASRAGNGQNYVSLMESGSRQPSVAVVIGLERALDLSPGELIRRTVNDLNR